MMRSKRINQNFSNEKELKLMSYIYFSYHIRIQTKYGMSPIEFRLHAA